MAAVTLHGQIGCSSKDNVVQFVPRDQTVIVPIPAHLKESEVGAVICSGNSLKAEGIQDGDILLFSKKLTQRQALFNICVVFILSTGETVGKKVVPMPDDKVALRASADGIADIIVDRDDIEIKGILLGFTRMMGDRKDSELGF